MANAAPSTANRSAIPFAVALLLAAGVSATFVWLATESPGDRYGPQVAGTAIGVWLVTMAGRLWWTRRVADQHLFGALSFHPIYFVLLISSSVYTLLAMQEADLHFVPSPDQPDFVPGLFTDLSVYYLAVHAGVVALIALYGQTRGRVLETAAAVQVVFLAPLFEPVLQLDTGAPLMLGLVLVIVAYALSERGDEGLPFFRWTPFGAPLVAFLLAGLIVTGTAAYVQHSLVVLAKLGALIMLALLLFQIVRGQRQLWLVWAAVVLPVVGMAIVHLTKMFDIGNNMGIEFAIRLRFHFFGLIGANTIGLALAVDILLILAALFWTQRAIVRAGLLLLLVPVIPSLLSVRSSSGLVALAIAFFVVAVASAKRDVLGEVRRQVLRPYVALAALTLVSAVVAVVVVPNPYQTQWRDEVSDPTTGRGVRAQMWRWALEDIKDNPVVGIGLTDRRFEPRAQRVPEFPFREVTQLIERRLLLGGEGTEWRVFVWAQPHNIVLLVAETMGLVGFAAFAWLCLALGLCGIGLILAPMTRERWVMIVSIAGVGGGLAWSFFALGQDVAYLPLNTWVLLGLLGAGYCMAKPPNAGRAASLFARLRPALDRLRPLAVPVGAALLLVTFLGMVARPVIAETFARRADAHRVQAEFPSAIDDLKIARRFDPLQAGYTDLLAQLYFRTGQQEKERSTLERLLDIQPETASNHARIAWTYWYQGDFPAALAQLERAVQLDPWNSLGSNDVYSLALAYQFAGRRQEAIDTFEQAFFIEPGLINEGAWYPIDHPGFGPDLVLDPAYSSNLSDERLQLLLRQRVYGLFTNIEPPALPAPADRTLYLSDVLEDGYRDYQTERETDPKRAQGMLSALERTYAAAGLHQRSLDLAREASEELPDKSYVFYDLGLQYAALDRNAEARAAFDEALRLSKSSRSYDIYEPFIYYRLGLLDQKAGDYQAALASFRKTLDTYRWPYFPEAYLALADAATRTGHEKEAASTLRKLDYLLGKSAGKNPVIRGAQGPAGSQTPASSLPAPFATP